MRTQLTLTVALTLVLASGCKKDEEEPMGPECTKLQACCKGNATCTKIVDDDPEASCKSAQAIYCVDAGTASEAGTLEAGSPEASTCPKTKAKGDSCTPGSVCCVEPYSCGYMDSPDQKKCCVPLAGACTYGEDCCQLKSGNPNICEDSKCCVAEGRGCFEAKECCPSAPNCTDGKCAK